MILRLQGVLGKNALPISNRYGNICGNEKKFCQGMLSRDEVFSVCSHSCSALPQNYTVCPSANIISLKTLRMYFHRVIELKFVNRLLIFFFCNCTTVLGILHEHLHVFHCTSSAQLHNYLSYRNSLDAHFVEKRTTHTFKAQYNFS